MVLKFILHTHCLIIHIAHILFNHPYCTHTVIQFDHPYCTHTVWSSILHTYCLIIHIAHTLFDHPYCTHIVWSSILHTYCLIIHIAHILFYHQYCTHTVWSSILHTWNIPYPCSVLSKFVGQSDIFYECPTKNVRVPDQMSDRKYKNIHLVDEKKQNTSDHKRQQLGFMSSRCFFRHS